MKTLSEVRCVELDIHIWTARKKLQLSDLKNVSGDVIPPDKLASLGSKIICDPDDLKVFKRLRQQAGRACESVGTRFLGGYAVPVKELDNVVNDLAKIKQEFDLATQYFLDNYESNIEKWIQENSQWASIIRRAVTPLKTVKSRMGFDFHVFRVSEAVDDVSDSLVNRNLQEHTSSLGERLFKEVAKDADAIWEASFSGRDQVTRRVIGSIGKLRKKLSGFAVVDPRVSPVVNKIDRVIEALPKSGTLRDNDFHALESLVMLLQDRHKLREYGEATLKSPPKQEACNTILTGLDNENIAENTSDSIPAIRPESTIASKNTQSWSF